jgi:hypothetical protein
MNREIKFRAWNPKEWNYALELKDLKANSVRIVNMDKVKIADLSKDNLQGE